MSDGTEIILRPSRDDRCVVEPAVYVPTIDAAHFLVPREVGKLLSIPNPDVLAALYLPDAKYWECYLVVNLKEDIRNYDGDNHEPDQGGAYEPADEGGVLRFRMSDYGHG